MAATSTASVTAAATTDASVSCAEDTFVIATVDTFNRHGGFNSLCKQKKDRRKAYFQSLGMQHLPDGKVQTRTQTKVIRKKVFMVTLLFDNPLSIELAIYRGSCLHARAWETWCLFTVICRASLLDKPFFFIDPRKMQHQA